MIGYSETFRGDVTPWEVDATEHFTVAYYYEKFEAATWRFLRERGVDPAAARTIDALTHSKAVPTQRRSRCLEAPTATHSKSRGDDVSPPPPQKQTGVPLGCYPLRSTS